MYAASLLGLLLIETKVVIKNKAEKLMGLSARTDDFTGMPIGEGYIHLSTSAGNGLVFRSPAEAYAYKQANPGQFSTVNGDIGGNYNDETALAES